MNTDREEFGEIESDVDGRVNGSAEREIAEFELEVYRHERNEVLNRLYNRTGFEPAEHKTPLDALLEPQKDELDRLTPEQLADRLENKFNISLSVDLPKSDALAILHGLEELEQATRRDTIVRTFDYIGQDGLEIENVMKNVYAVAAHMSLDPWYALTVRERGIILGDSHGSQHWRTQRIVNRLRRTGAKSYKAPGQKTLVASAKASRAQQGNSNRKRKKRSRLRRWKRHQEKIK